MYAGVEAWGRAKRDGLFGAQQGEGSHQSLAWDPESVENLKGEVRTLTASLSASQKRVVELEAMLDDARCRPPNATGIKDNTASGDYVSTVVGEPIRVGGNNAQGRRGLTRQKTVTGQFFQPLPSTSSAAREEPGSSSTAPGRSAVQRAPRARQKSYMEPSPDPGPPPP